MQQTVRRLGGAVLVTSLIVLSGGAMPAGATFPGANGRIAFVNAFRPGWRIWSVRPDGSGPRRLTRGEDGNVSPAWAPDGRRIAYESFSNRTRSSNLMTVDPHGQNRTLVLGLKSPAWLSQPTWSPDGTQIAFLGDISGAHDRADIVILDLDDLDTTVLRCLGLCRDLDWSPEGSRFAFISYRQRHTLRYRLMVMDTDGTGVGTLTREVPVLSDLSWSPDGTQIVFGGTHLFNIFTIGADGTGLQRVTKTPNYWEVTPAWSPNGRRIV